VENPAVTINTVDDLPAPDVGETLTCLLLGSAAAKSRYSVQMHLRAILSLAESEPLTLKKVAGKCHVCRCILLAGQSLS
jgi:hypothetical protein